jgi:phosphoglycolate phosphatase-like HAD superfamily hydrolase
MEQAIADVLHKQVILGQHPTAGRTDSEIFSDILSRLNQPVTLPLLSELLERYAAHLPGYLPRRAGQLLDSVSDILSNSAISSVAEHALLTGNYEPCAWAKLTHYGITHHFIRGWFCQAGDKRNTISQRAAHALTMENRMRRLIIGDTVHDAHCARSANIPCLGVATDHAVRAAMITAGASAVAPKLPPSNEFLSLVLHVLNP